MNTQNSSLLFKTKIYQEYGTKKNSSQPLQEIRKRGSGKKELLLIEKKYQRILLERSFIFRLLLKIRQETKLHMTIVNLLKQENENHVNNARDVFVKNFLQKISENT